MDLTSFASLHKVYLVVFLLKLALVVVLMVWPKVRY